MDAPVFPKHRTVPTMDVDNDMVPNKSFFAYVVGRPGSGKSTFVYNLLNNPKLYWKRFEWIFIVSPNAKELDFKVNPADITETFDLGWVYGKIEHCYNAVKTKFAKLKAAARGEGKDKAGDGPKAGPKDHKKEKVPLSKLRCNACIVFDDVIAQIKANETDPRLATLLYNRRHFSTIDGKNLLGVSVIVTSQKYTMLPARIRTTVSWLVFWQQPGNDLGKIFEEQVNDGDRSEFIRRTKAVFASKFAALQIRNDLEGRLSPITPAAPAGPGARKPSAKSG